MVHMSAYPNGECDCRVGKFEKLQKAAQPLIDYLQENHNMMCYALVSIGNVEILENKIGMPIEIND